MCKPLSGKMRTEERQNVLALYGIDLLLYIKLQWCIKNPQSASMRGSEASNFFFWCRTEQVGSA